MRGFLFLSVAILSLGGALNAQEPEKTERLDSAVVSASRAGKSTPVTYTMVGKDELRNSNPVNSLPMVLGLQPSVVVTSEGGTGIGYSKMTVRGSKGTQINVTLNGITLNDGESQEVFWVNIPALGSLLSGVQVQRGLGTSSNGPGAFGASINMNTAFIGPEPAFAADFGIGSYDTRTALVSASSGLLPSGLYTNVIWTTNTTEGYVNNGWGNANSLLAVLGWLNGDNSLRFTYLRGKQNTGITWTGTPQADMERDRRFNPEGIMSYDADGKPVYYRNHSDNYLQQHFQLNWTHRFTDRLTWINTVNYTDGFGYNERFKKGKKLSAYGFPKTFTYGYVTYKSKGDAIFRKTMANGYWVGNSELKFNSERLNVVGGVNASRYACNHYGELLWHAALGESFDYKPLNLNSIDNNWYFNRGVKKEINAFARAEFLLARWLTAYADLQYRRVRLDMSGIDDDDDSPMDFGRTWKFFNPRAGLTADTKVGKIYASVALGNREPSRSDIKEVIESNNIENTNRQIKPEKMTDIELGYSYTGKVFSAGVNLYMMEYKDMLLETGELTTSGYAIKDNVDKGYRRGIELTAAWKPFGSLTLSGNATLSTNKIKDYISYYSVYDNMDDWNLLRQEKVYRDKVTMLMSPSVIAAGRADWTVLKNTVLSFDAKYVGKQYWDNTQCEDRAVPAYWVADASLSHEIAIGPGTLGIGLYIKNLFNRKYYADAWVYRAFFEDGGWYQEEGLFPQATRNCMVKLSYRF